MAEVSYYTKEGLEKLKEELQYLKTTGRLIYRGNSRSPR
jgi:transcription elongation factor GreA